MDSFRSCRTAPTQTCRSLASSITVLSNVVMQLQDNMTKVLDMNARLVESVEDLTSKNELLAAQVASLTTELSSSKHNVPSTQPTQPTQRAPNLLIGASTIRDIACTDPKRLYVVSRWYTKNVEGNEAEFLRGYNHSCWYQWLYNEISSRQDMCQF